MFRFVPKAGESKSRAEILEGLEWPSDKMRLDIIREDVTEGVKKPTRKELNDAPDLVIVKKDGEKLKYYELYCKACWDGLYAKEEYKGLSHAEAIDKFMKERFPAIAERAGATIDNYIFNKNILEITLTSTPQGQGERIS
jgi:hypothetical protein